MDQSKELWPLGINGLTYAKKKNPQKQGLAFYYYSATTFGKAYNELYVI